MTDRTERKPTTQTTTYADQLAAAQELVKRTDAAVEKAARMAYSVVRCYKAAIGDKPPAWAHAGAETRAEWLALAREQLTKPLQFGDGGVEDRIARSVIGHVLRAELGADCG